MKKILLLISILLFITGCKVEYNLEINDTNILENVEMTGTDEFFNNYYKSSKLNVVNMIFDEERKSILNNNGYENGIIDAEPPYVFANKEYDNITDYSNNTIFFKQYFEELNVVEKDGVISLKTKEFIPINPDRIEQYDINASVISIKSSYKVLEHNASSYDKKNNIYMWFIEDTTTDFSINFTYDTNEKFIPPKDEINWFMILAIVVFLILLIIIYIFTNKKNK